jgi:hypothetical protein
MNTRPSNQSTPAASQHSPYAGAGYGAQQNFPPPPTQPGAYGSSPQPGNYGQGQGQGQSGQYQAYGAPPAPAWR